MIQLLCGTRSITNWCSASANASASAPVMSFCARTWRKKNEKENEVEININCIWWMSIVDFVWWLTACALQCALCTPERMLLHKRKKIRIFFCSLKWIIDCIVVKSFSASSSSSPVLQNWKGSVRLTTTSTTTSVAATINALNILSFLTTKLIYFTLGIQQSGCFCFGFCFLFCAFLVSYVTLRSDGISSAIHTQRALQRQKQREQCEHTKTNLMRTVVTMHRANCVKRGEEVKACGSSSRQHKNKFSMCSSLLLMRYSWDSHTCTCMHSARSTHRPKWMTKEVNKHISQDTQLNGIQWA